MSVICLDGIDRYERAWGMLATSVVSAGCREGVPCRIVCQAGAWLRRRSRIESYSIEEVAMRTTKQMSVTLPHEMADMVRAKVASGEYASESEVIREGLRALIARDRAVDAWLLEQVAPAFERVQDDPSKELTAQEVRAQLAALRDHDIHRPLPS